MHLDMWDCCFLFLFFQDAPDQIFTALICTMTQNKPLFLHILKLILKHPSAIISVAEFTDTRQIDDQLVIGRVVEK